MPFNYLAWCEKCGSIGFYPYVQYAEDKARKHAASDDHVVHVCSVGSFMVVTKDAVHYAS